MPTYRDEAVVLRHHKLEADRIITLLSRTHGKIRAVARGVRRTSSKFGGRLEPFSHVDVQFATGRSPDVVTQCVTLHAYDAPLRVDYASFTAGSVMLENRRPAGGRGGRTSRCSSTACWSGALRTTGNPGGSRPATMVLDSYLLRAMSIAGYAPATDSCAAVARRPARRVRAGGGRDGLHVPPAPYHPAQPAGTDAARCPDRRRLAGYRGRR